MKKKQLDGVAVAIAAHSLWLSRRRSAVTLGLTFIDLTNIIYKIYERTLA